MTSTVMPSAVMSIHEASRTANSTAVTRPMRTAKPPSDTAMIAVKRDLGGPRQADGGEQQVDRDEGDGDGRGRRALRAPDHGGER